MNRSKAIKNPTMTALDYTFCKEYDTMLLRKQVSIEQSYVRDQLYDEGRLSPYRPLTKLVAEMEELLQAARGKHKNKGHRALTENVAHELADCIFRLMLLDISLGGTNYYEQPWPGALVEGMSNIDKNLDKRLSDIIWAWEKTISARQRSKYAEARLGVPVVLNYFGRVAVANGVALTKLVSEVHEPHRWSRRTEDMRKRLDDMATTVVQRDKRSALNPDWKSLIRASAEILLPVLKRYLAAHN
ncbi:MAG: MazG-like family protein [Chloroflexi bacterium]|nr:MazG-like family protein [Chloroflexota bacterium]